MKTYLKRSSFLIGSVAALRGFRADLRIAMWCVSRRRKIRKYLNDARVRKLHIGASNSLLPGWLNTDIASWSREIIYMDATRRFPIPDDSFDYVMAEHVIEHVDHPAAQVMLQECYRILKPGGKVRLATPDLEVLIGLHSREKSDAQRYYIDWIVGRCLPDVSSCKDVFVINNAFRAWGHRFLYDRDTLGHTLAAAGFDEVKTCRAGISEDPNLQNLEAHGKEIQDEQINQFETIVLEATCKKRPIDTTIQAGSAAPNG